MESQELEDVEAFEEHLHRKEMGTPSYEDASCCDVFLRALDTKGLLTSNWKGRRDLLGSKLHVHR